MKRTLATLCVTLAVLLGSAREGWSADFQKGFDACRNYDYATALEVWKPLAKQRNADAQFYLVVMYQTG